MSVTADPNDVALAAGFTAAPVDTLADDLRGIIEASITNAPRTLQTWAGPSELGVACDRCLVHKLAQTPTRREAAWLPTIGTAVHEHLEGVFLRHEMTRASLGMSGRFLAEGKVAVGVVGGRTITGHTDLFDVPSGTTIDWKGLKLDTPIPTVDGWKEMRHIEVGDKLFDRNGNVTTVTHVFPRSKRQTYEIAFTNGTTVVCDDVHQWFVRRAAINGECLLTAGDIADLLGKRNASGQRVSPCSLPLGGALDLPDVELVVPPYTLGAWLGDGASRSGVIGKPDDDLFERIRADGYEVKPPTDPRGMVRRIVGLTAQLRQLGVLRDGKGASNYKRIPDAYLRASRKQRLDLLRGLMDTDGTWNTQRGEAVFEQVDARLAPQVAELVASLGWRPYLMKVEGFGFGKAVASWRVAFAPIDDNPFHLPRKAGLVKLSMSPRRAQSDIRSVTPLGMAVTQCIAVDSLDHSFLCTRDMLPTHNCVGDTTLKKVRAGGISPAYAAQAQLYGRGWEDRGYAVRHCLIYFLPRNAKTLERAYPVIAPYSRAAADVVLHRVNAVAADIDRRGVEAVLASLTPHTGEEFSCADYPDFNLRPISSRSASAPGETLSLVG